MGEVIKIATTYGMYTHGHSMQIEYPNQTDSIWRAGFYIRVTGKPGTSNWFHFAVPTTAIVRGRRLRLGSTLFRFRTGSTDAYIHSVHIYDGEIKIAAYEGLKLSPSAFETAEFKLPSRPTVKNGIGISIGVSFGSAAMDHWMDFSSAAAKFVTK